MEKKRDIKVLKTDTNKEDNKRQDSGTNNQPKTEKAKSIDYFYAYRTTKHRTNNHSTQVGHQDLVLNHSLCPYT